MSVQSTNNPQVLNEPQKEEAVALGQPEAVRDERFYYATQGQLVWWRFKKHKVAVIAGILTIILYLTAIFADFVAPYGVITRWESRQQQPPSTIYFYRDGVGITGPYVYPVTRKADPKTFKFIFVPDTTQPLPIKFFAHGEPYKILGIVATDIHLFGTENLDQPVHIFGTDRLGRDLFSRVFFGAQVSLSIGLVGVFISFLMGVILGGLSGYMGGVVDELIQRTIDFLLSIPTLPLWMALSSALPRDWPIIQTYFAIVLLLSVIGWAGLARVVRGKLLQLREEDYAMAAQAAGASKWRIITRHLLPGFTSHLIVSITVSIPSVILGETALSFIGVGMQPPAVSWGTLLQDAQNIVAVAQQQWLMIPALFVIVTVLLFNFVGDGLRDAADPYSN